MAFAEKTSHFLPFAHSSTTLLTGPSNIGKTTYVKRILENSHLFFEKPIKRVIVINYNPRVTFYTLEQQPDSPWPLPPVEQYLNGEFQVDTLEEDDCIIFGDLQGIPDDLRTVVNLITHHVKLAHCFVVTHGLLNNTDHFALLQYVHRIVLFTQSKAVCRLARYINATFFTDPETKEYLKQIIGVAERHQQILHLELN